MYNKKNLITTLFIVMTLISLTPISTANVPYLMHKTVEENHLNREEGYILFTPERSTTTYLLDYNKEVVHTWENEYTPGHSTYLLENGLLLRTIFLGAHPIFLSGGMGGGIQEIDWNGTIVWDYRYSSNSHLSHHDVQQLPNGNILMIAWETKNFSEAVTAGRNPSLLTMFGVWPDHIVEVKPTGPTSGDIVWEWHVWDHLIQDYDASKANYGVVADHPELIDINYGTSTADWLHTNSIDYNEELDQILVSVHNFDEIWVIDHSTTTTESTGHTGGLYGKGGDLLYRWGNPIAYHTGTTNDQKLFGQHDVRWIKPGCPGSGDILIFNNGLGRPEGKYSSIDEIVPPVDANGTYYHEQGSAFGPEEPKWMYTAEDPTDFYSYMISGAQRLENGNTIICDGKHGFFFEVTSEKETIWEYTNPYPTPNLNNVFTIERYASNYSGLSNIIQQPNNPNCPEGTTHGEKGIEYTYSSTTTDPQNDSVYFMFDWGDSSSSDWIGPYASGDIVNASHSWTRKGNFDIKVKAKDSYGHQSDWSNPLSVTMPTDKIINILLLRLLQNHPVLTKILELLFQ